MFKNLIRKTHINVKFFSTKTKVDTDVCIIGGGSIGMTLSCLLTKFGVDHIVLEKEKNIQNLFNHPKAHYISPKAVEAYRYIEVFDKDYFTSKEFTDKVDSWRHYRYCEYLLDKDSYYGEIDHLRPNKEKTLAFVNNLSNAFPLHIGQNKLNKILFEKINQANFISGTQVTDLEYKESEGKYKVHTDNENLTVEAKLVVGCDGAHSAVRNNVKAEMIGPKGIQSFVNAHFFSKDLANALKALKKDSMLHFIFNPKYVCVLISYDLDEGEFVMQIPFFTGVEKEADYPKEECERIIRELIGDKIVNHAINLKLEDVKFWKMNRVVADRWYKDRVFIIGDAAHQFPPSGGYGLNTGVADALSLAWRLKYMLEAPKIVESVLKETHNQERITHASFVSKCAGLNYNKFSESCRTLGLNIDHANFMQNVIQTVVPAPIRRTLFETLMSTGISVSNFLYRRNLRLHLLELSNQLQLIFPYLDYAINYKHKEKNDSTQLERLVNVEDIPVTEGVVIPNFSTKKGDKIREYLKTLQNEAKDKYPLFFLIRNEEKIDVDCIKLFQGTVGLNNFKFVEIVNDKKTDFYVDELKTFKCIVVRPDFLIEYIKV